METRAFRLTVRFLLSTVPAPCGVQKPTGPLSSKTLPPLSSFYSGCVMCKGVACGSLLVEALHHPRPCRKGQSQISSLPSPRARGGHLAEVVNNVHLSCAPWHLFTGLTERKPSPELPTPLVWHKAASLRVLSEIHGNPVWYEKSISSQHLIVLHNDNILCCRELPSS